MSPIEVVSNPRRFHPLFVMLGIGVFIFVACEHAFIEPTGPAIIPTVAAVSVKENAQNVLSAAEYDLDENAKTAELVWEYSHEPPLYSFALGFAQRLANGNTLISYGTAQRIIEVDRSGIKHWELAIDDPAAFVYRAFRIDSLY